MSPSCQCHWGCVCDSARWCIARAALHGRCKGISQDFVSVGIVVPSAYLGVEVNPAVVNVRMERVQL